MKNTSLILIFLTLSGSAFLPVSFADEAQGKEAYGMVKTISNNQMVVTVYDAEKGQAQEQTFALSPQTQLAIVRPASEVLEGDEVKIAYREEGSNKKANFVSIIDLPAPPKKQ